MEATDSGEGTPASVDGPSSSGPNPKRRPAVFPDDIAARAAVPERPARPYGSTTFRRDTRPAAQRRPKLTESQKIHRTLWVSIVEGIFTSVFLAWTAGAVLTGYMLYLGAGPIDLALVASVPLLAQVIAPVAAWIEGLAQRRMVLVVLTTLLGRGVWILAPLIPVLALPPGLRPPQVLILLVAVSSLFQASAGAVWTAWMGDVVPEDRRGHYFGLRGGIVGVVVLVANLAAGRFLDSFEAPFSFQLLLILGLVFAAAGIYLYTLHHDPPAPRHRLSLAATFRIPFHNRNFRRFLVFAVYWQAAVFLVSPFVYPYFIEHLKMTFTQIAIWVGIASVVALAMGPLWGKLADRVGNKAVLAITTFLVATVSPLTWMLARPGHPMFIYVNGVIDGLLWSGLTPAILNLALATAPRENRIAYLSVMSLAAGLAGFAAGLASGYLLGLFHSLEFSLWGYRWTGYHWIFMLGIVVRANAWRFIRPIKETNAWRTRDVLRAVRQWRMGSFPWR